MSSTEGEEWVTSEATAAVFSQAPRAAEYQLPLPRPAKRLPVVPTNPTQITGAKSFLAAQTY